MLYRYNKAHGIFTGLIPGMDQDVVGESYAASHANALFLPNISTCTGLVLLLNDASLIGAHLDKGLSEHDIYVILQKMDTVRAGRNVTAMMVFGNLRNGQTDPKCFMSSRTFSLNNMRRSFAEAFNYAGVVFGFDQGPASNYHYKVYAANAANMLLYYARVAGDFDKFYTVWIPIPQ
jgi:hypothetical protein